MRKNQSANGFSGSWGNFASAHARFYRYLGALTAAGPISLWAFFMPAYASQRKLFEGLSSLTCIIALALLTSKAVALWHQKGMNYNTTGYIPKILIRMAISGLMLSVLTASIYLYFFGASVTVQSALMICQEHAEDNEFARDTLLALTSPGSLKSKVQIAEGFLLQWHTFPIDLRKRTIDSAVDIFYGGVLLLLNVVTVVSLQAGLFLLAISNLFIVPPKKVPCSARLR
jgi:hypothetical protein